MSTPNARWGTVWLAPLIFGAVASSFFTIAALPRPRVGEVTGIVILDFDARMALDNMLKFDPDLRVVDQRWGGRAVFVVFARPDFPRIVRASDHVLMFDAKSFGCAV
jgi:hypothetical protein